MICIPPLGRPISSFFHRSYTIGNSGKPLESVPIILTDVDFQIQTNGISIGDRNAQLMTIAAGNYLSYRSALGVDLSEIWCKNTVADSVCVLICTGILKGE